MAIITTAEYNAYATLSGQDALVAILILSAQAMIERYCGVASFDSATYTLETYDGSGTDAMQLVNRPVTAVSAVKIRSGLSDATPDTLETNTYTYNAKAALLYRLAGVAWAPTCAPIWPEGRENVLVTYTAGYSSQTMPADLKMAMFRLVDMARARIGRDPGLQSESMGAYSWTAAQFSDSWWRSALTPEVVALLSNFTRGST